MAENGSNEQDTYRSEAEDQLTQAILCITEPGEYGVDDVTPRALLALVSAVLAIDDSLRELARLASDEGDR